MKNTNGAFCVWLFLVLAGLTITVNARAQCDRYVPKDAPIPQPVEQIAFDRYGLLYVAKKEGQSFTDRDRRHFERLGSLLHRYMECHKSLGYLKSFRLGYLVLAQALADQEVQLLKLDVVTDPRRPVTAPTKYKAPEGSAVRGKREGQSSSSPNQGEARKRFSPWGQPQGGKDSQER